MTAQDSFYAEIATFKGSVLFNGLEGVARTGRLKAAPLSDHRTDNELISPNKDFYQSLHVIDWYSERAAKCRASATSDRAREQTVHC